MRLWSLHPRYLDRIGLIALWREGLLAQAVLAGRTRGYRHHPQLARFREHANPQGLLSTYLKHIAEEARRRGYAFDATRILPRSTRVPAVVTTGQLQYEWQHLLAKLRQRDRAWHRTIANLTPEPHPLFRAVDGPVASWERT